MQKDANHSIIQRIRNLPLIDELYDEDERRPSSSTVARAEQIISNAIDAISAANVADLDIHPYNGAIRVIWSRGPRTLKLVVSSGKSYLYHQDGDAADLSYDLSVESIGRWMCWLSAGGA